MRPRLAALVAALTVVPMTVATMAGPTQAQEPHPRNSSTSTKTASPEAVAAAAGSTAKPLKVVLLGDSYSAGNGARDASDDRDYYGPSGCFRSHSNWSSKYVELLQRDGYNVTFDNRACSGGVTSGMVSPRNMDTKTRQTVVPGANTVDQATAALATLDPCNTRSYIDEEYWTYKALAPSVTVATVWTYSCTRWLRPQTDFVGADTDLVLFTIGGNDIKFESIVKQCFVPAARSIGRLERGERGEASCRGSAPRDGRRLRSQGSGSDLAPTPTRCRRTCVRQARQRQAGRGHQRRRRSRRGTPTPSTCTATASSAARHRHRAGRRPGHRVRHRHHRFHGR